MLELLSSSSTESVSLLLFCGHFGHARCSQKRPRSVSLSLSLSLSPSLSLSSTGGESRL